MKTFFITLLSLVMVTSFAYAKGGTVSVKGYYRSNGTYVAPHMRSAPNGTAYDNWSYKGNVNPYTGKTGTNTKLDQGDLIPLVPNTSLNTSSYNYSCNNIEECAKPVTLPTRNTIQYTLNTRWVEVISLPSGNVYIDKLTLKVIGNSIWYWSKETYKDGKGGYTMGYWNEDCGFPSGNTQYKFISVNETGGMIEESVFTKNAIVPDTPRESIHNFICNFK